MFLRNLITTSTESYSEQIDRLKNEMENADAVVIGTGAGMSTSAGFTYDGERFERYFSDFHKKYGIRDIYSGGFYPYDTLEEYWAWWSRHIFVNRYDAGVGKPYTDLLTLIKRQGLFCTYHQCGSISSSLPGLIKGGMFYTQGVRTLAMLLTLAIKRPMTMKNLSVKWSPNKKI